MASEFNSIHIVGFALQPVSSRPDRNDAVHLRFFIIDANLDLEQLSARDRSQVIHRFEMIEHIHSRYAYQQIKAQLVAQKARHRYQVGAINFDAQVFAFHRLQRQFFPGDLRYRRQVTRQRCILIAIAPI